MSKIIARGLIAVGILVVIYGIYIQFSPGGYGSYSGSTSTAFVKAGGLVAAIGAIILGQIKKKEFSPNSPEVFSISRVLITVVIIIAIIVTLTYLGMSAGVI